MHEKLAPKCRQRDAVTLQMIREGVERELVMLIAGRFVYGRHRVQRTALA